MAKIHDDVKSIYLNGRFYKENDKVYRSARIVLSGYPSLLHRNYYDTEISNEDETDFCQNNIERAKTDLKSTHVLKWLCDENDYEVDWTEVHSMQELIWS